MPFANDSFELVLADLCLHYFREQDTIMILDEIKRILKNNGYLIFRVNSINDTNHGAGQGKEVEPRLYRTGSGTLKRFFVEDDIRYFLKDFDIKFLNEEIMRRYELEKVLYRVCAQKKQEV